MNYNEKWQYYEKTKSSFKKLLALWNKYKIGIEADLTKDKLRENLITKIDDVDYPTC